MARPKTVTEARLEQARADLAHVERVIADERAEGNDNPAFWADIERERSELTATVAKLEKGAAKRRKANARSRARYAALRGVGLRRTADGWE